MGGAPGLRAARCAPFGRGLSGAAREQPATVGVGPARTVGGMLWGPRGTRTANGRGVHPLGSGTRLEPSSADRPHLGSAYIVVVVWLPSPINRGRGGWPIQAVFWLEWEMRGRNCRDRRDWHYLFSPDVRTFFEVRSNATHVPAPLSFSTARL